MDQIKAFKVCPMCSTEWKTRDDFLDDKTLEINGYGVDFERLEWSLFYFTHKKEKCLSTLAIEAKDFLDLYSGKKYQGSQKGSEDCPRFCLDKEQLDRCDVLCECAFNREIIHIIKKRHSK